MRENAKSQVEDKNKSKRKACSWCTREDLEQAGKVPTIVEKKEDKETKVGFQVGHWIGIVESIYQTGSKDKTANTEGQHFATELPKINKKVFGFYPQRNPQMLMNTNSSVLQFQP